MHVCICAVLWSLFAEVSDHFMKGMINDAVDSHCELQYLLQKTLAYARPELYMLAQASTDRL